MRRARARRWLATLGVAAAGLAARNVLAHHSPARYDLQAQRTVEGTIANYEWGNPARLCIRARERHRPHLGRRSVSVDGDEVSTDGRPTRFCPATQSSSAATRAVTASRNILFLKMIRKADAAVALYDSGGAEAALPNKPAETFRATSVAGTWMSSVGPLFGTFFGPGVVQISTPQGAAAVGEFRDTVNPGPECVPFQPPVYMILPGFRGIEVRGDTVTIRGEDAAVDRIVHLDVATHDGAAPSVAGHSIGRWEGDTLVVDTAGSRRIGSATAPACRQVEQAPRRAVRGECPRRAHVQLRARGFRVSEAVA